MSSFAPGPHANGADPDPAGAFTAVPPSPALSEETGQPQLTPASGPSIPSNWNQAFFEWFFEHAPFYVGIVSPEGILTETGQKTLEAFGYQESEVI